MQDNVEVKGINSRIIEIMNDEGLTKNAFGKRLGLSQTAISRIEANQNYPSFKLIVELLGRYPNINSDWLILGKGPKNRTEYGEMQSYSAVNEPLGRYETEANPDVIRETLNVVKSQSAEKDKLIEVIKDITDEMVRYGARFDRILGLMEKLYGVSYVDPEEKKR